MTPCGYLPDGTPLYFKPSRMNGKSTLQLEMYARIFGWPLEELRNILKKLEEESD